jgi:cysteine-rich repeat protein
MRPFLVGSVLLMLAARAVAVDMTGAWIFHGPGGNVQVDVAQSGTVLTLSYVNGSVDVGTIDPPSGVFHVEANPPPELCDIQIDGVVGVEGFSFIGTYTLRLAGLFGQCEAAQTFAISGVRCPGCVALSCGDGVRDVGEACDDGNRNGGDCCSPSCTYEAAGNSCVDDSSPCTVGACDGAGACVISGQAPAGTACTSDGTLCTNDICDDAGSCSHRPYTDCRLPSKPASLSVRHEGAQSRVRFLWKDASGSTTPADLGDPTANTQLRLCVFSGSTLALDATLPAADGCGTPPCWKPTPHGFSFKSRAGIPQGITRASLRSSLSGRTTLMLKGRGPSLAFPAEPTAPLTGQLSAIDAAPRRCWQIE